MKVYGIYKEVFPDSGAVSKVLYMHRFEARDVVKEEMKAITESTGKSFRKVDGVNAWNNGVIIIEIQAFTLI